jgi:hypothetical protein
VTSAFKQCPKCGTEWLGRDTFLADPDIRLIGYQVSFGDLVAGHFQFNHERAGCGTTLALAVEAFRDLYDGPIFEERATGTSECPEKCLHPSDLEPCPAHCECAFVRAILQLVLAWPKRAAGAQAQKTREPYTPAIEPKWSS